MTHESQREEPAEATEPAEDQTSAASDVSRRDALARIGKGAVYAAPAVLAVFSAAASKDARADSTF